ncbi:MAG: toll/interleukin-1 receptor domain-containing protein [Bacteroidota bacterium]
MTNQLNWKSFLWNINNKGIVPIIGNDLSIVRLPKKRILAFDNSEAYLAAGTDNGDYISINLYKFLALQLWYVFGSGEMPSPLTVDAVFFNLQNNVPENDINAAVKKEILSLTDDQIVLDPYRNLAKMKGFETFITVNADNFLERAFQAEGLKVNKSLNFSIPLPATDPNNRTDPSLPKIYNLMGSIEGANYALSDEQKLEYLYMLQNGSDVATKELFDVISRKNILLIGSSFPDWFMRFFIRIISRDRFKNGGKAKYVACDSTLQDNALTTFLENYETKIIPIGKNGMESNGTKVYKSSIDFLENIYTQSSGTSEVNRNEPKFKELVFMSYSRDDRPLAERLKNELEKNGVNVFFDDDTLNTGDRFNQVIKNYIRDCDYFMALISENAIADKDRYVYIKEWRSAIVLDGFKDQSYIRPFIIDDTRPVDARIPEEIRSLNIKKINMADDLSDVVRKFMLENKFTSTK